MRTTGGMLLLLVLAASGPTTTRAFTLVGPATVRTPTTALDMARGPPRRRRPMPVKEQKPPMNGEIAQGEIRVVVANTSGGKDEPLGVMTTTDALARAKAAGGLDLILVNSQCDPPVCKIADYSKYRYIQEKKAKEVKKNSKVSEVKEVKMSYKIDVHDYDVRKKNAYKFLQQGNRVKCTVMFRGREVQHDKLGFELLDKLGEDLAELAAKEGQPKREGRNLSLLLSPRAEVMKALSDGRRAEEKAKKKKKEQELEQRSAKKSLKGAIAEFGLEKGKAGDNKADEDSLDALLGGDAITKDLFK
jgi:translation initiation factor IF-3